MVCRDFVRRDISWVRIFAHLVTMNGDQRLKRRCVYETQIVAARLLRRHPITLNERVMPGRAAWMRREVALSRSESPPVRQAE
jgi:hypothetical protein